MIHLEDFTLYATLILGGAFIGGLLIAAASRRNRYDYNYPPSGYYRRRPRYRRGYYDEDYRPRRDSTVGFMLFIAIILLAMLWYFAGDGSTQHAAVLPAVNRTAAEKQATVQVYETCYLEFGGYPTWELAQAAYTRMMVEYEQNLKVLQCEDEPSPYRVVLGPFRNKKKAAEYRDQYNLRADIVGY